MPRDSRGAPALEVPSDPLNGLAQRIAAAAVVFLASGAPAYAQIRPPSPEEILRFSPDLQFAARKMGDERCAPTPKGAHEVASLSVASVVVQGATVFRPQAFLNDTQALAGHKVSPEALTRAAEAVVCRYRSRGYVFARAEILRGPGDAWRISVSEGVLARLEAAVDDPRLARMLRRAFAGLVPGKPISAYAVRRGLVLAGSLGLKDVRPTVRADRAAPAQLDILLVAAPSAAEVGLEVDDFNSAPLGRWGALGTVQVNGLTPLYDHTSFALFKSLGAPGQWTIQTSSHALAPGLGVNVGADFAYSIARPRGELTPLDIESDSWFARVSADRLLVVTRGLVAHAAIGLEAADQSTDILGGKALIRDRLRVAYVQLEGEALAGGGLLTGELQVRQGLSALGATSSSAPLPSVPGADPQALVLRASASFTRTLGLVEVNASVRGQYAGHTLLSFEQMTFGALNGGRGFDPSAISGDRGVAASVEAQGPVYQTPFGLSVRPFLFTDAADITLAGSPAPEGDWAVSAGGGLRFSLRKIALNVTYAGPIRSGGAPDGAYGQRLLVGLSGSASDPIGRVADLVFRRPNQP